MKPDDVCALIEAVCAERDLPWESTGDRSYVVTLPGQNKLKTACNLIVGEHALRVEAFVMRQPDENRERLWAWLCSATPACTGSSSRSTAPATCTSPAGYSLHAVTADEMDRLLGAVVTYADESFNPMLEIGYGRPSCGVEVAGVPRRVAGQPEGFEHFVRRHAEE